MTTFDRHGIFRFFDRADPSAPHLRREPYDIEVLQDGQPAEVEFLTEDRGRFLVAQDRRPRPHLVVRASTRTAISYRVDDVLIDDPNGDGSRFYWQLLPGGWAQQIDAFRAERAAARGRRRPSLRGRERRHHPVPVGVGGGKPAAQRGCRPHPEPHARDDPGRPCHAGAAAQGRGPRLGAGVRPGARSGAGGRAGRPRGPRRARGRALAELPGVRADTAVPAAVRPAAGARAGAGGVRPRRAGGPGAVRGDGAPRRRAGRRGGTTRRRRLDHPATSAAGTGSTRSSAGLAALTGPDRELQREPRTTSAPGSG